MSKRLEILQNSLAKKQAVMNAKVQNHFDTVKLTNGQPLNDKRNGRKTLNKWQAQSDAIAEQQKSIERTERAIEIEKSKINFVNSTNKEIPQKVLDLVEQGVLSQWRKYPNRFFVNGVEKARFIVDLKTKKITVSHFAYIPTQEQKDRFKAVAKLLTQD